MYFSGKKSDWKSIVIGNNNAALTDANFEYAENDDPGTGDEPDEADYTKSRILVGRQNIPVRYKNKVTVIITGTKIPKGGYLVVNGTKIEPDSLGKAEYKTTFQADSSKIFTAHIEDKNGNIRVAVQRYVLEVDTGFFAKISAFFMDFLFNGFKWKNTVIKF